MGGIDAELAPTFFGFLSTFLNKGLRYKQTG